MLPLIYKSTQPSSSFSVFGRTEEVVGALKDALLSVRNNYKISLLGWILTLLQSPSKFSGCYSRLMIVKAETKTLNLGCLKLGDNRDKEALQSIPLRQNNQSLTCSFSTCNNSLMCCSDEFLSLFPPHPPPCQYFYSLQFLLFAMHPVICKPCTISNISKHKVN